MSSVQETAQKLTTAPEREASFSRALDAIVEKFEKTFRKREASIAKFEGEAELERQRAEFERELWLLRVHLVEERPSIEYDNGDELKEMISNKLAVSAVGENQGTDWWWTPANFEFQGLLQKVQSALEKETQSEHKPWRKGLFYVWSVLGEIVYLSVILGAFSAASSKFESIVFAALVLIYNSTTVAVRGVGLASLTLLYRVEENLGQIGRALKLRMPVGPANEVARQVTKTATIAIIHNISIGIGSLIALWHLVTAILA
jgi:hypothetical protein